ncbi:MAG: TetR/AcrR family transcriptional regulator [Desulfobacterales bacterium]|jgi:AcrR family transcriptional regulator|nr:TetR/AcrR family transcriptional regulator [Desulfobacterales bacterium]
MNARDNFKQLDKSLRLQSIIDTAIDIFHRMGYRAATLDNVASELGITRSALYHYVSSKEDLLATIYLQTSDRFFAKAYEIGDSDLSPLEKLHAFLRHNLKRIVENLAMFVVFFNEQAELPAKEASRIAEEKRKYTAVVEKILEQGMAEGVFRRSPPKLMAYAILGMCNWTYKWYKPGRDGQSPEEIADHFIALIERGILADKSGRSASFQRKRREEARRITDELKEKGERLNNLISDLQTILDR